MVAILILSLGPTWIFASQSQVAIPVSLRAKLSLPPPNGSVVVSAETDAYSFTLKSLDVRVGDDLFEIPPTALQEFPEPQLMSLIVMYEAVSEEEGGMLLTLRFHYGAPGHQEVPNFANPGNFSKVEFTIHMNGMITRMVTDQESGPGRTEVVVAGD